VWTDSAGEEVAYEDIVKGEEVGDGTYVIVTPEELEEIEPGRTRTIDISDFVDIAEIDPVYFQKSYYLGPQSDQGQRAYGLLLQAMERAGRVGIATVVMRSKEYLAAIRPQADVLVLETMLFADEVRDPVEEIETLPVAQSFGKRDLDMATLLIDSMTTAWDPTNYTVDGAKPACRFVTMSASTSEGRIRSSGRLPRTGTMCLRAIVA
jgi:DNA end-binding protein Ku